MTQACALLPSPMCTIATFLPPVTGSPQMIIMAPPVSPQAVACREPNDSSDFRRLDEHAIYREFTGKTWAFDRERVATHHRDRTCRKH